MRTALIIGCDGQDGRILYDYLLKLGYDLIGISRTGVRTSGSRRVKPIDIRIKEQVLGLVKEYKPDEIYYLAAYHHSSQDVPRDDGDLFLKSYEVHVLGLINFLEAIRLSSKNSRIFYPASSLIFGTPKTPVQDEATPINPEDIYGITKAGGVMACRLYRRQHAVFAAVGICYNHESHLRDAKFISRKIILGAIAVKQGKQDKIILGDLTAEVDWGYAPDFIDAMHKILNHDVADDFVISSGQKHTVLDFVKTVCDRLGLNWESCVKVDPTILTRKKHSMVGNSGRLMRSTGWKPSVTFEGMIDALLAAEMTAP